MASVVFYFQVHQPFRLRRYSVFDSSHNYFCDESNEEILRKVARKCYLPTNQLMLDCIREHEGRFRISYAITGTLLEQCAQWMPEVLDSFKRLVDTGCVEIIGETYFHSLSFLYDRGEFRHQIQLHSDLMEHHFGVRPKAFRNTELTYNNEVAQEIEDLGFETILTEGADHVLGYRSPNYVYNPPGCNIKLMLKNYRLSDDIAFRFGNKGWPEWPLTTEKFANWVDRINGNGYTCNLFMDYETFGEHQWAETGIFDFMHTLPGAIMQGGKNDFLTVSEASAKYPAAGEVDIPRMISWADAERDLTAWLGNSMQANALQEVYHLHDAILRSGNPDLEHQWRKLQTSDHFYYMCTKFFEDGDVHKYFSPYESPYDAYINFMNILDNIRQRINA
ncbi:MAG: polysaccharide deacetylase family protein [Phycisphaerales bacterium]|jgi:alpha-amylase|nr:polysaccharide deacetylase family protein [Phycisphaerales bacterium]MBT7170777.1 polysaccharide deacetylase family protein [Phycisphaerales bacterium]